MSTRRIASLTAPKGFCRGCQQPVPKGRYTWCSDACVEANLIKLSPATARAKVEERDHGICSQCGVDTERCRRVLWHVAGQHAVYRDGRYHYDIDAATAALFLLTLWRPRRRSYTWLDVSSAGHFWEADHTIPVVEGGGECELDNYRTLCIPCHRAETRELAGRRAQARRKNNEIGPVRRPMLADDETMNSAG